MLALTVLVGCGGPPEHGSGGPGLGGDARGLAGGHAGATVPGEEGTAAEAVAVIDGARHGTSRDGAFTVSWTSDPDPLPFNALFSVVVEVTRTASPDEPAADVDVLIGAFMPGHGHGMNRLPRLTRLGPGRFRADGMLFHMPGTWELVVSIYAGQQSDLAVLPIVLE